MMIGKYGIPVLAALLIAGAAYAGGMTGKSSQPSGDAPGKTAVATFAGGCFWCMEPPFDAIEGVISTTSGYTGGHKKDPTYKEVSGGSTGHAESVQVVYDPEKVSYEELLETFWTNVDPHASNSQFCDGGNQYRSAIFYHDEAQRVAAEASKQALLDTGRIKGDIFTQIVQASVFYPAEAYHQDYYQRNPIRYKIYRTGCGRDRRLKQIWGADAGGGHHG